MLAAQACTVQGMSEFGARLTEALRLAAKERKELAAHLRISVQAVGAAIRDGKFTASNTAKAARFLRVDWYWLATGEGEARPAHHEAPVTDDAQLLEDFYMLTSDEQEALRKQITDRAAALRAYLAQRQANIATMKGTTEQAEPTTASGLPVPFVERRSIAPATPPHVQHRRGIRVFTNPAYGDDVPPITGELDAYGRRHGDKPRTKTAPATKNPKGKR